MKKTELPSGGSVFFERDFMKITGYSDISLPPPDGKKAYVFFEKGKNPELLVIEI